MSGGSWKYVYQTFENVGERLAGSDDPHRVALGTVVDRVAAAMRAIEWVDSCDSAPGAELPAILEAIGGPAPAIEAALDLLQERIEQAEALLRQHRPSAFAPEGP